VIQKIIPALAMVIPKSRDNIRAADPTKKWLSHQRNLNRKARRRSLIGASQNRVVDLGESTIVQKLSLPVSILARTRPTN
jgi:hypothetical protein